jgi:hypothetical protein
MKELEVFGYGILQDVLNVLEVMEEAGITKDQLKTYMAGVRVGMVVNRTKKIPSPSLTMPPPQKFPKCPQCGQALRVFPLKGNELDNPQKYTFRLACIRNWQLDDPAMQCGYEELHTGEISKFLESLI